MRVENGSIRFTRRTPRADQRPTPSAISTQVEVWGASGEIIHAAYIAAEGRQRLRSRPERWYRRVMDDAARDQLVCNVVGHLKDVE